MIKNIGTGPRVSQTVSDDSQLTEKSATPQQDVTKTLNDSVMKPGNTSIAAENQISVLAMQSDLQNKLLEANKNQWSEKSNPRWTRPLHKNEAENWAALPVTLATGSGDDEVDIKMGNDGRVHVNVNGKEEWSGTPRQFRSLNIFTGDGNDVIKNSVDGAHIATGLGNDVVWNEASNVTIDSGGGKDEVRSKGSGNEIRTGSGDDLAVSVGDHNSVSTGSGNDSVRFKGEFNQVNSGGGDDDVTSSGGNNTIKTEDGND